MLFRSDIGARHTGTLSGAMNMMGAIGALLSAVLFPFLSDLTGNIKCYFYVAAFLNLAAMAGWAVVLRNEISSSEEGRLRHPHSKLEMGVHSK